MTQETSKCLCGTKGSKDGFKKNSEILAPWNNTHWMVSGANIEATTDDHPVSQWFHRGILLSIPCQQHISNLKTSFKMVPPCYMLDRNPMSYCCTCHKSSTFLYLLDLWTNLANHEAPPRSFRASNLAGDHRNSSLGRTSDNHPERVGLFSLAVDYMCVHFSCVSTCIYIYVYIYNYKIYMYTNHIRWFCGHISHTYTFIYIYICIYIYTCISARYIVHM